jgi:hypothetical protein
MGVDVLTPFLILVGAGAVAFSALLYVQREPAVRGRFVLLGLRILAIAILVLLLLDVSLPGGASEGSGEGGGPWVLVDPDLSLSIPDTSGGTVWDGVVAEAALRAAEGARLAVALPGGGGLEGVQPETLETRAPAHPPGDVTEAVLRLGEAGADSVVLFTSLRWTLQALEALGAESPLPVRVRRFGDRVRNFGLAELELPARARAGEEIEGRVAVFAEGTEPGDSVQVELRANGVLVQTVTVPLPVAGIEASASLLLPPASDTGLVRYTARGRLDGDVFPDDDLRARWVSVGTEDGGIVLVSLAPDFEPRALLPVLEAVTGMPGDGYLGLADGRFLPLVSGPDAALPISAETVRARVPEAELLVVHGMGAGGPEWLDAAIRAHPRVLHLSQGPEGAALSGLEGSETLPGEWEVVPDVPPSPVTPFVAGLALTGLPPLSDLHTFTASTEAAPTTVALNARAEGGGEPVPAMVLVEADAGRRVVALANGFSRWAARDGEPRRVYRSLWGGVAQWLLSGSRPTDGGARPREILQARGEPVRWDLPAPDSEGGPREELEVSLVSLNDGGDGPWVPADSAAADGATADETVLGATPVGYPAPLAPDPTGLAATPPPDPGVYRFEISARETGLPLATGVIEVERWVPSLRLPPLDPPADLLGTAADGAARDSDGGRPLRTNPLAFLVLLLVLCAEWMGRRRLGLR